MPKDQGPDDLVASLLTSTMGQHALMWVRFPPGEEGPLSVLITHANIPSDWASAPTGNGSNKIIKT